MSYQLKKCDFKEKLIEIDIARYLGCFTPRFGRFYYLENADEQLTGADLVSEDTNATLIYIQAKVSQGLKTISKYPASNRKNRSKLEDIREFRDSLSLDENDSHFFYFQLRKKAETATDFQHNILMNYANTGFSHAFYVAPLSIEKVEYQKLFLDIQNFPDLPFFFHHYELRDVEWTSYYGFIPFLRNHISIIPHERVDTNQHYYAYSKDGIDVTWHSPEYVDSNPSRLGDRMTSILRNFYYSEKSETIRTLASRLRVMPIMQNAELTNEKPIDIIAKHGHILEREFGIKQLLLTRRERR
ncbi:MAG TPA: hypothetical protein VLC98_04440 [Phnomibacter sp.]|nr:hypothetical protein [Phnomibacter sp.]